jgi:hypothetical protein
MIMRWTVAGLIALGLLGPGGAHADSIADVFRAHGFEGTWSGDCSDNQATRVTVDKAADGTVSLVAVGARGKSRAAVRNAASLGDDKFAFDIDTIEDGQREVSRQEVTRAGDKLDFAGILLERCKP